MQTGEGTPESRALDIFNLGNVLYGIFSDGNNLFHHGDLPNKMSAAAAKAINENAMAGRRSPAFADMADRLTSLDGSLTVEQRLARYEAVELHDLILRMTDMDPSNRLSIQLVLKHP
eukprot:COSAG02_NODE_7904_length_2797_cov_7.760359_2_plen_116_part_01